MPSEVQARLSEHGLQVTGPKGEMMLSLNSSVKCIQDGNLFTFQPQGVNGKAMVGTMRSLTINMVIGVTQGFEKRLILQGVGYRAQMKGKALNLQLGYSHPIVYELSPDVQAEIPSQTEIVIRGIDKQKVGQAASEIRAFRPPEPYKGKGVRYADERILRKEGKKK